MRSRLVVLVATAALAVWLTYRGLVTSPTGQRLDQLAMVGSMAAAPVEATHLRHLLHAVSVPSVAVAIAAATAVAGRRSRPELGAAAAAMVAGANLTTQALKHLAAPPRPAGPRPCQLVPQRSCDRGRLAGRGCSARQRTARPAGCRRRRCGGHGRHSGRHSRARLASPE